MCRFRSKRNTLVNLDMQMFLKGFVYIRVYNRSFLFYNDLQAILL